MIRDPTLKIGCTLWERGSRVGMTGVFYSRDARLSISSSPMIVWARNLFSCILQATSSKLLWYQAIFIVGIIHSQLPSSKFNMPILCAQSLRLPSSKFKMPTLCTQSLRLPSSKSKRPILCTQSLRLPSPKKAMGRRDFGKTMVFERATKDSTASSATGCSPRTSLQKTGAFHVDDDPNFGRGYSNISLTK